MAKTGQRKQRDPDPTPAETAATPAAGFVTIQIPIAEFDPADVGYQSAANPPRRLMARRLTPGQGVALARVRAAMVDRGEIVDKEPHLGGRKTVSTKEDCVTRILELIHAAIESNGQH